MSELIVEPRLGLRRRRRAIPDEGTNEGFAPEEEEEEEEETANQVAGETNDGNNNFWDRPDQEARDPPHARRVRRLVPPPPEPIRTARPRPPRLTRRPPTERNRNLGQPGNRVTQVYCAISAILAILAIVIAPSKNGKILDDSDLRGASSFSPPLSQWRTIEHVAKAAVAGMAARRGELPELDTNDITASLQKWWNAQMQQQQTDGKNAERRTFELESSSGPFWWWRHNRQRDGRTKVAGGGTVKSSENLRARASRVVSNWIERSRGLQLPTATPTEIIDNILTSIPRLLAIANFMLTITYMLHYAIASWFLDDHSNLSSVAPGTGTAGGPAAGDWSSPARERMGGFLVFKLLLISAVVAPDTLDLLILLSWYTTLSCLRSLDHLAHARTTHLNALGQPPRSGVLHLLLLVLVGNIVAAASCVALFHSAGWGMVLLLTYDCVSLAADVLSHILKYFTSFLDDVHSQTIQSLEARQLDLHNSINNRGRQQDDSNSEGFEHVVLEHGVDEEEQDSAVGDDATRGISADEAWQESRHLDRRMESLELAHARRLSILDNCIFALDLLCHVSAVAHFSHIWSLHGVQFTLIDAVLALHLHSAISTACKKIAQHRNMHGIAKDLQNLFPNASDEELRKASVAGDVCCICLGTMSTGGHVKKVPCGHLYHTHCLREVVERAQSVQAAKCPLCRSSLLNGRRQSEDLQSTRNPLADVVQEATIGAGGGDMQPQQGAAAGDQALIRFSTEDILPDWLPVPAFSFEVVRRAPAQPTPLLVPMFGRQNRSSPAAARDGATRADGGIGMVGDESVGSAPGIPPIPDPAINLQQDPPSFFRRLLILAGAIPMTPEEEARALAHLVDMFPQYERSHLLRELRERGSAEAVVEAIMMGIFTSGVPRGGA